MTPRLHLLAIDPQNDFCDLPESHWPTDPVTGQRTGPALPVAGAHADLQRLAALVTTLGPRLDAITVTLDSHRRYDIAHPPFWQTGTGEPVAPFTAITAAVVRAGAFRSRDPAHLPRALAYLDALEAQGRYTLMVWPVHCEIGSWGHNLHADLRAACGAWEEAQQRAVQVVFKGSNPWTEHYSALQAEVPDAVDPDTQLNQALIAKVDCADLLLIGGEASSHCVRATVEHLAAHLPSRRLDKLVLLTDCMSPVSGFEAQASEFLAALQAQGARLMTAQQSLELCA